MFLKIWTFPRIAVTALEIILSVVCVPVVNLTMICQLIAGPVLTAGILTTDVHHVETIMMLVVLPVNQIGASRVIAARVLIQIWILQRDA